MRARGRGFAPWQSAAPGAPGAAGAAGAEHATRATCVCAASKIHGKSPANASVDRTSRPSQAGLCVHKSPREMVVDETTRRNLGEVEPFGAVLMAPLLEPPLALLAEPQVEPGGLRGGMERGRDDPLPGPLKNLVKFASASHSGIVAGASARFFRGPAGVFTGVSGRRRHAAVHRGRGVPGLVSRNVGLEARCPTFRNRCGQTQARPTSGILRLLLVILELAQPNGAAWHLRDQFQFATKRLDDPTQCADLHVVLRLELGE